MEFDLGTYLWPNHKKGYFRELEIQPRKQQGPTCVATSLAILTNQEPAVFQGKINTQNPVSWSKALVPFGMKLAYCPTDARKLMFYLPELQMIDDLFTLSYYTPHKDSDILGNPNEEGWVCGSHVVVLHRDQIYNPANGSSMDADAFLDSSRHTKRIFRVVPVTHARGL